MCSVDSAHLVSADVHFFFDHLTVAFSFFLSFFFLLRTLYTPLHQISLIAHFSMMFLLCYALRGFCGSWIDKRSLNIIPGSADPYNRKTFFVNE
jgi:hypothetical protein